MPSDPVPGRLERAFGELADAVRAFQRATEVIDSAAAEVLGVNRTDLRCLDVLDGPEPMTAGRLAEESGLTTGAVTAVLDRLERAGYVRRVRDAGDRRRVLVELTPKAQRLVDRIYGPLGAAAERWMSARYSPRELGLLAEFLQQATTFNEEQAARIRELADAARRRRNGRR